MNHIDTMKQALEALESCGAGHISDGGNQWYSEKQVDKAIATLREALASEAIEQPAKDEFKAAYIEAMVASNEAGFAGMSAAETIRELSHMVADQPAQQQEPDWLDKEQAETDWDHVWLLIKAASYASSKGFISGTTNWGSVVSRYMRNESPPPAQQEPVASIFISGIGEREFDDWGHDLPVGRNLLYTSPPAQPAQRTWQGLMDEEIAEQDWRLSADRTYEQWTLQEQLVVCGVKDFARAIEAKLQEKNNA